MTSLAAPDVRGHKRKRVSPSNYDSAKSSVANPSRPLQQTTSRSLQQQATSTPKNAQRRSALLQARQSLPIYTHASSIRSAIANTHVLLLSGETGSGKSTQVPQFLLSEPWCTGRIAVTQPRRMAAISLARRVADELGTPLGKSSPAAKVGYSVRFDDNVGRSNRVKYLTEGMLLQEMLRDPGLCEYSVVVVDEVHERSVNVDLILGFLRELVLGRGKGAKKRKERLKVVVMSATADTDKLKTFFDDGFQELDGEVNGAGNGHVVEADDGSESDGSWDGFSDDEGQKPKQNGKTGSKLVVNGVSKKKVETNGKKQDHVSMCFVEGRQYPVQTIYLTEPAQDFVDAALKCIFQAHCKEPMPGDILVFLTGQDTVLSLQKSVEEVASGLTADLPKLLVLPLFAALTQASQQRIFEPSPPNTRKLILATNIAETSITVPGVRFVIDCGKAKIKQYRTRLGLDSLLVKPVSQSSAIQRRGRAGREAPGKCWRLYMEKDYVKLEKENAPEILRCDLAAALLTIKASGVEDILGFPLLTPPSREAMERALLHLLQLRALEETDGSISEVGRKISRLPLTPALGAVVIAASQPEMDCVLHVIDIVACFSVENIFLGVETEEAREDALDKRRMLFRRQGDHLTLLAAVQAYAAERTDRKRWCERHLISHRAMQSVMDVRKQLRAQSQQARLLGSETLAAHSDEAPATVSEGTGENILKCFLRGFNSNVARLMPDGSYRTLVGNQTVAIHPSSVLFGRKVEAVLYNEFVFTNRTYARGVSAVQLNWLEDLYQV